MQGLAVGLAAGREVPGERALRSRGWQYPIFAQAISRSFIGRDSQRLSIVGHL